MSELTLTTDQFEALVGQCLRTWSAPDASELTSLEAFVAELPERGRAARLGVHPRLPARRSLALGLIGLALAAIVVGAVGLTLYSVLVPTVTPSTSPTATATPSPSPSPTVPPPNPAGFANDRRYQACTGEDWGATRYPILAATEWTHASDYRLRIPDAGFVPELENGRPVVAAVYEGASPTYTAIPEMPSYHQPDPGRYDVCVAATGDNPPNGYPEMVLNVKIDWGYFTGVATPPASEVTAVRMVKFAPCRTGLVWDEGRGRLWCLAGTESQTAIYSLDLATGKVEHWAFPGEISFGTGERIRVDASGAIWVWGELGVIRFDPATGQSKRLILSTWSRRPVGITTSYLPPNWAPTYVSALAIDGDSAIVAQDNTAHLTRVSADMKTSQIPISGDLTGIEDMVVAGGRIYFQAAMCQIGILSLSGQLEVKPGQASCGAYAFRLEVRPTDGAVILWTGDGKGRSWTPMATQATR